MNKNKGVEFDTFLFMRQFLKTLAFLGGFK